MSDTPQNREDRTVAPQREGPFLLDGREHGPVGPEALTPPAPPPDPGTLAWCLVVLAHDSTLHVLDTERGDGIGGVLTPEVFGARHREMLAWSAEYTLTDESVRYLHPQWHRNQTGTLWVHPPAAPGKSVLTYSYSLLMVPQGAFARQAAADDGALIPPIVEPAGLTFAAFGRLVMAGDAIFEVDHWTNAQIASVIDAWRALASQEADAVCAEVVGAFARATYPAARRPLFAQALTQFAAWRETLRACVASWSDATLPTEAAMREWERVCEALRPAVVLLRSWEPPVHEEAEDAGQTTTTGEDAAPSAGEAPTTEDTLPQSTGVAGAAISLADLQAAIEAQQQQQQAVSGEDSVKDEEGDAPFPFGVDWERS